MFRSVKTQDSYGNKQTHYYLTQGDSCKITSTPYKDGVVLTSGISNCYFKLATLNYVAIKDFEKIKMEKSTQGDFYELKLSGAQTEKLEPGQYRYEIEYELTDGVATTNAWKFDILPQIKSQTN